MDNQRLDDQLEPIYNTGCSLEDMPGVMDDRDKWYDMMMMMMMQFKCQNSFISKNYV